MIEFTSMYIYIYIHYICIYVYMYTCIYVCMHDTLHIYQYVYTYIMYRNVSWDPLQLSCKILQLTTENVHEFQDISLHFHDKQYVLNNSSKIQSHTYTYICTFASVNASTYMVEHVHTYMRSHTALFFTQEK